MIICSVAQWGAAWLSWDAAWLSWGATWLSWCTACLSGVQRGSVGVQRGSVGVQRGSAGCSVAQLGCNVAQLGCNVAQLVWSVAQLVWSVAEWGAVWLSGVQRALACCKAGPSSNLCSAPHSGSAHWAESCDDMEMGECLRMNDLWMYLLYKRTINAKRVARGHQI